MKHFYDISAPKKPANVTVNSDLLAKSKAMNINLSATLEQALKEKLTRSAAENWTAENREAIEAYNGHVEEFGCFGDDFREF